MKAKEKIEIECAERATKEESDRYRLEEQERALSKRKAELEEQSKEVDIDRTTVHEQTLLIMQEKQEITRRTEELAGKEAKLKVMVLDLQ